MSLCVTDGGGRDYLIMGQLRELNDWQEGYSQSRRPCVMWQILNHRGHEDPAQFIELNLEDPWVAPSGESVITLTRAYNVQP